MTRYSPTVNSFLLLTLVLVVAASPGEESMPSDPGPAILAPTQGRPVFVAPGAAFRAVIHLPTDVSSPQFTLASTGPPSHEHKVAAESRGNEAGTAVFQIQVPGGLPEKTYDLVVQIPGENMRARHAVAVAQPSSRLRLVHLSNMNVGEPGVPTFDPRLIDEINLLGPDLIVATGDYLDATHPDPVAGWQQLSGFLSRFDAPVLAACGDHDDLACYSRHLAPSPIGSLEVGPYRGVVLYDTPGRPISQDQGQLAWIERQIGNTTSRLTFVVSHDESPNLLRTWQERNTLPQMLRAGRLGIWFAGGHRDWDRREYRPLLEVAKPMLYIRTHQSSIATRDGASGVSHYRIIDLNGEHVSLAGAPRSDGLPDSTPVGRLHAVYGGPNDGSRPHVCVDVVNALPYRLDHLRVRLVVRRVGDEQPWCRGARFERIIQHPGVWECYARFDLPDKAVARIAVGSGSDPPPVELNVVFDGPTELRVRSDRTPEGLIFAAARWPGTIAIENRGESTAHIRPLVRLDGDTVAYRVIGEAGPFAAAYNLRLAPGQRVALRVDLSALRIAPGRRALQVYLRHGPAWTPASWPLDVKAAP